MNNDDVFKSWLFLFYEIHAKLNCFFVDFFSSFWYTIQNSFDNRFFRNDTGQLNDSAESDDQTAGKGNVPEYLFHDYSFRLNNQQKSYETDLNRPSVPLVCLADVDQRQHHEDERLQHYDKNVEQRPQRSRDQVPDPEHGAAEQGQRRGGHTHQRDQQEEQLARIHVAEQPHAMRDGLGDELDELHQEVGQPEQGVIAKRRRK